MGLGAGRRRFQDTLRRIMAPPPSNSGVIILIGKRLLDEDGDCHLLGDKEDQPSQQEQQSASAVVGQVYADTDAEYEE